MKIWKIEGTDLAVLKLALINDTNTVHIGIDDDDLKLKVNEGMWTLGLGKLQGSNNHHPDAA